MSSKIKILGIKSYFILSLFTLEITSASASAVKATSSKLLPSNVHLTDGNSKGICLVKHLVMDGLFCGILICFFYMLVEYRNTHHVGGTLKEKTLERDPLRRPLTKSSGIKMYKRSSKGFSIF